MRPACVVDLASSVFTYLRTKVYFVKGFLMAFEWLALGLRRSVIFAPNHQINQLTDHEHFFNQLHLGGGHMSWDGQRERGGWCDSKGIERNLLVVLASS
jgi:hypothetical protein